MSVFRCLEAFLFRRSFKRLYRNFYSGWAVTIVIFGHSDRFFTLLTYTLVPKCMTLNVLWLIGAMPCLPSAPRGPTVRKRGQWMAVKIDCGDGDCGNTAVTVVLIKFNLKDN